MNTLLHENRRLYRQQRDIIPEERYRKIRELVAVQSGRVLDIGTYDFGLLSYFAGFDKFGIDLIRRHHPKDVQYCIADVSEGIPFSSDRFDVVVAGEVIEHLLDTVGFLTEIRRVLKTRGELVLSTPNMSYWRNHIQILLNENPFWVDWKNGQEGHVRYFSPKTIREIMVSVGFKNIVLCTIQDAEGGQNKLLRILGRIMQQFSRMHNMLLLVKGAKA